MGNSRIRDEHNDRTMVERIDPLMGTVLAQRYRIDFRLASGGFGAIYRATHIETGQQYALKVLHAELATADARVIARFRREADTLSQLRSPNTIQAYEIAEAPDGSLYIVMELLHGESLYEQFRAKGVLAWERVVHIGRQVCNSLAEAHALGIIHRDLKPANIHLETRDGKSDFVKVLDFGIAKIMQDSELDSTELTQAGQMIGTFDYMAPEQMVGGQCTGKTDIYTLGIVMYEMICGRRPFADASSPTAMLAALLTQAPPPLGVRGVPGGLEEILLKCLEREPQHRYDDVTELATDLDRLMTPVNDQTIKLHTPTPIIIDSEATVVAQPRAKRGTPPPSTEHRPRRGSEPPPEPRAKRESSPPSPNVIRREGSSPAIPVSPEHRAKRESSPHVVHRDRPSQPVPLAPKEPAADPNAWQSLQLPKRERETGPVARGARDSQPVPVLPKGSGPGPDRIAPERPTPPPQFPAYQAPPAPAPDPFVTLRGAAAPSPQQTPSPTLARPPTPAPFPVHVPVAATPDPRASLAAVDPNAWRAQPPTPPRGSMLDVRAGYDMAGSQSRDVLVRRIVWGLALVLGLVLILVIASRL